MEAIRGRLAECGLELHPEKTRIVYCKDSNRREEHEHVSFDFLGYTFRPREGQRSKWQAVHELYASYQQQGNQGNPTDHPRMADGSDWETPNGSRILQS
ncbi:hypothetical protein NKJ52_28910 [Mesorhizobium australicum]|uniref:hypothetical protein n=1 Tax=Mesorhizobium australicum TaxID=536018 RepID=UPI0033394271